MVLSGGGFWLRGDRFPESLMLEALAQGASLTAAAHDAGFTDSAHLTHTFRDHFGLAPTDLLAATRFQPPD